VSAPRSYAARMEPGEVSLAGVGSSLGSEEESFVYESGGWFWAPSTSDIAGYRGTVAHIVAVRKAAGDCG
jgi:hypothetical protein